MNWEVRRCDDTWYTIGYVAEAEDSGPEFLPILWCKSPETARICAGLFNAVEIKELPHTLRQMRGERTLKEIAERSGISLSFISDIERGRTKPSLGSLEALISVYGGRLLIWMNSTNYSKR